MNNSFRTAISNLRGAKAMERAQKYADDWREAEERARKAREAWEKENPVEAALTRVESQLSFLAVDAERRASYEEDNGLAMASLFDLVTEQSKQIQVLTSLVEKLLPEVSFDSVPREFRSFDEVFAEYAKESESKTRLKKAIEEKDWVIPPVKKVKKEKGSSKAFQVDWKRGRKPKHVTEAYEFILSHTKGVNVRWRENRKDLIYAFLAIAEYEGFDIENTYQMQQSKYKKVCAQISNNYGSYKEFVAAYLDSKKEVKEA